MSKLTFVSIIVLIAIAPIVCFADFGSRSGAETGREIGSIVGAIVGGLAFLRILAGGSK